MPVLLKNHYVLTELVRKGAQATVTKALDTATGSFVAIKRVPFGPDDARAREAFQREVKILQSVSHPNIVKLMEVDRDEDGNWFLVLEWVDDNFEDVIKREGPMSWAVFWDRFGKSLLDAICVAQQKQVAHRDIKPKNILVDATGVAKLADYGIGKLVDNGGGWSIVSGLTFRFDHTPGYTPKQPDDEKYVYSRDCFSFAALAVSCVAGRIINDDDDIATALQEASLPPSILPIMERCLSVDPAHRPVLASLLMEDIQRAMSAAESQSAERATLHLSLGTSVVAHLENILGAKGTTEAERFVIQELSEICSFQAKPKAQTDQQRSVVLIGGAWLFEGFISGRCSEIVYITKAREVTSGLAGNMRDDGVTRPFKFDFGRGRDPEKSGRQLEMLVIEAEATQRERAEEREAKATQRIFKAWRGYLKDRADLETRRGSALKYVNRQITGERVIFTTELSVGDDVVGQERLVQANETRIGGRVALVSFNQLVMDVTFGNPMSLPRRGELKINTIAAQKALSHQTHALDALIFDRAVEGRLKEIILTPSEARSGAPVTDVVPTDEELDGEKQRVLAQALGIEDLLVIEGPPGTGKTKLIAEIVVQWLRKHPTDRILMSSQTHIALDNVLERVAAMDASVDLIRIGRADEPRISDASKKLLLEKRVENWITDARRKSEDEMTRWAEAQRVDRTTVRTGMSVEKLIQLLLRQERLRKEISEMQSERDAVADGSSYAGDAVATEAADEETTQIDSEIGELRAELKEVVAQEGGLRAAMRAMGGYAADLGNSNDHAELMDWAQHFLSNDPKVEACRARLQMLEDWHLRVGRSSDFNAAVLSAAQVIAGTCIGVAAVKGMEEVAYDLCIIDEASKATPTEALVPMVRSRKWILVGDPKQLPPFFENLGDDLLSRFDDREIKGTLLDRFLDDHEGLPSCNRVQLRNQYRMIQPIGNLVSRCFYDGRLNSPIVSHGLKLDNAFPAPVTWLSTHTQTDRREHKVGQTFDNPGEVRAIRAVLQRLQFVAKAQRQKISVAVIAGYMGQVQLLREMESQGVAGWPDLVVQCNSVDAFQGSQADVCIYSVVRSNSQRKLGFLRDAPRLNVALSRGKSGLVIVGDQMFCRSATGKNPFGPVIDYIEQHPGDCCMETLP